MARKMKVRKSPKATKSPEHRPQLPLREAAVYIGRSIKWLRQHSVELPAGHPDRIPYWKTTRDPKGHVMFDPNDIDEWIAKMKESAEAS